ncbi:MAG: hypothetical protein EOP88_03750 [Verrucomicrobiaceae bacterium]|nr:MAG: hypothetical protein EOP88_03750 [Verrucomicrobiaceae bacterium]
MRAVLSLMVVMISSAFAADQVQPVSDYVRKEFKLAPFYQKMILIEGFPVVSSEKVNDAAVVESAVIVRGMLDGRDDIFRALAKGHIRLTVMATSERTCDVPEHSDLTPKAYWNRRARGLGATRERPSVSCAEENVLCCKGDPYSTESILVHEFAHAIHIMGLEKVDPTFDRRLKEAYDAAMAAGKWQKLYAAENHAEYWAEAVQSWFGTNRENDAIHNHVNTRKELIEYDPAVAKLCEEIFGKNKWQYRRADDRARRNEPHLKNLDRDKLPVFAWTKEEQETKD